MPGIVHTLNTGPMCCCDYFSARYAKHTLLCCMRDYKHHLKLYAVYVTAREYSTLHCVWQAG